jgi:hypothetical protein
MLIVNVLLCLSLDTENVFVRPNYIQQIVTINSGC